MIRFFFLLTLCGNALSFQMAPRPSAVFSIARSSFIPLHARKTLVKENEFATMQVLKEKEPQENDLQFLRLDEEISDAEEKNYYFPATAAVAGALTAISTALIEQSQALAQELVFSKFPGVSQGVLNPANFNPVCPASDSIYRFLQQSTLALVGKENFVEYGPLVAGGLLRVRLELCVVESFFQEAVGPFIAKNGLSWVLPLHETVETFLAGGIFALATTFILIGSTKIVTILLTYLDFLLGLPARILGGFVFDRAQGKPVTLDIGFGKLKTRLIGPPNTKAGEEVEVDFKFSKASPLSIIVVIISGILKAFGEVLGFIREALEKIDFFVGRYLVLWASGYIIFKFLHFKVFPDFP